MSAELVEVQPQELKFVFETKKQSSCAIQLISNSDQYVAFKVKTTSPKKYCVRPNIGVIKPKETCDFTVTMQAQRAAPPDFQCRDKFLIQSTIVPFGVTEEDITSEMFARDSGKIIEDKKLKVILVSPPNSPVLLPVNGVLKQDTSNKGSVNKEKEMGGEENIPSPSPVLLPVNRVLNQDTCNKISLKKEKEMGGVESILSPDTVPVDEGFKFARDTNESRTTNNMESIPNKDGEEELKLAKNIVDLKLAKDVEDMRSNLNAMKADINEAELRITKLTLERTEVTKEKEMLKQELEILRQKSSVRTVQVGFPFLFVVMVSLISLALGRYMHL